MKTGKLKRSTHFLYEMGSLRKLIRAHRQSLLTEEFSDNIASHSFRVAWIGWILAQMEKADPGKVILMCLMHDIPEARSGDQNWVHKRYVRVFLEEAIKAQLAGLPGDKKLVAISDEYQERKTKEALIAKDCDLLDQILLLKEYAWVGNQEAKIWLKPDYKKNMQFRLLKTKSAKKLAREIAKQRPSDWWANIWTADRR